MTTNITFQEAPKNIKNKKTTYPCLRRFKTFPHMGMVACYFNNVTAIVIEPGQSTRLKKGEMSTTWVDVDDILWEPVCLW